MTNPAPAICDLFAALAALDMRPVFRIPEQNVDRLRAEFAAQVKRSKRLKVAAPELREVGESIRRLSRCNHHSCCPDECSYRVRWDQRYVHFQVTGDRLRLPGYEFLGTVEHTAAGNIVHAVPTASVPEGALRPFRNTDARRCDHCQTIRNRKDTYLVLREEDGTVKQVGKSCLKDYTGHKSPEAIAATCSNLRALLGVAYDAEAFGWGGCGDQPVTFTFERFIAATVASMREDGWTSRGKARETGHPATADSAWGICTPPRPGAACKVVRAWKESQPEPSDYAKARRVLWEAGQLLLSKEQLTDYEHNLRVSFAKGRVDRRSAGIVASVIAMVGRAREVNARRAAERAAAKTSEWVGRVKDRLDFANVEVTMVRYIESDWGCTTLVKMRDEDGNHLAWFASSGARVTESDGCRREIEPGDRLSVRGTVKKHAEFRGVKETQLTRCNLKLAS